jgi:hypothetical protein
MLLICLSIGVGLGIAGTIGFGSIASKRGTKLLAASNDRDKYRARLDSALEQLQEAQEENLRLSTQILDTATENITPDQIMQFVKTNSTRFSHNWQFLSSATYRGLGPKKFSDVVISESCKCCGMVRRKWRDGGGNKYMKGYEGVFLGNKKIEDEFRQIVCIGLLPMEFLKKNNAETIGELTTNPVETVIHSDEEPFENIVNRSKRRKV